MFAVEVLFHDGVSPNETILVRRPIALIGAGEFTHVVIEGADSCSYDLQIARLVGRKFRCRTIARPGQEKKERPFREKTFTGEGTLSLGDIDLHVTALDSDLAVHQDESPDLEGIRVLREALRQKSPVLPAVVVHGSALFVFSFRAGVPLLIGRSRNCGLRLDSGEVSAEHVRLACVGTEFQVEDLGSKNGTIVGEERIHEPVILESGDKFCIGQDYVLYPVNNQDELDMLLLEGQRESSFVELSKNDFPCVASTAPQVQPMYQVFGANSQLTVGRDPENDVWVGVSHISRRHLTLRLIDDAVVEVTDSSSNGTYLKGERLPRDLPVELQKGLTILDLGAGISLGVCSSKFDYERYMLQNNPRNAAGKKQALTCSEPNLSDLPSETPVNPKGSEAESRDIEALEQKVSAIDVPIPPVRASEYDRTRGGKLELTKFVGRFDDSSFGSVGRLSLQQSSSAKRKNVFRGVMKLGVIAAIFILVALVSYFIAQGYGVVLF